MTTSLRTIFAARLKVRVQALLLRVRQSIGKARQLAPNLISDNLRLPSLEPIAVFGALKSFLVQNPNPSFFGFLILTTFFLNVSVSEKVLIREFISQSFGGPEASASEDLFNEDVTQTIFEQASLTLNEGVPEAFSGYFFVFEDSISGWSNPVSESLNWIPQRDEIITYEVVGGDSPAGIASRFGISVETILWANNLNRGSVIQPGQRLVVLPVSGVLHEVKTGETLGQIAKSYAVSESRILAVNSLESADKLLPGDRLIVPGGQPPGFSQALSAAPPRLVGQTIGFLRAPTTGWNWGRLHRVNAVDIANACGTPVFAAASGFVTDSKIGGWNGGYGNLIKIKHENGVETVYSHLSAVLVSSGAYVNQGDIVGSIGNTGKTHGPTGCHLHFEVRGGRNPFARY